MLFRSIRGDVSLNKLDDAMAEAHSQRFSNKIHEKRNDVALGDMLQCYGSEKITIIY